MDVRVAAESRHRARSRCCAGRCFPRAAAGAPCARSSQSAACHSRGKRPCARGACAACASALRRPPGSRERPQGASRSVRPSRHDTSIRRTPAWRGSGMAHPWNSSPCMACRADGFGSHSGSENHARSNSESLAGRGRTNTQRRAPNVQIRSNDGGASASVALSFCETSLTHWVSRHDSIILRTGTCRCRDNRMRRRSFIVLLGTLMTLWPFATIAEGPEGAREQVDAGV